MRRLLPVFFSWRPVVRRKSRLRQLAEDAALVGGDQSWTTDPTVLVAEHKIRDAQRRGVFEGLEKGKPLSQEGHISRDRADDTSYLMGKQMAAANVKPLSLELRVEVERQREALRRRVRAEKSSSASLREAAEDLGKLIKRQHLAAIGDAHAFSATQAVANLQVPVFDLDAELEKAYDDAKDST